MDTFITASALHFAQPKGPLTPALQAIPAATRRRLSSYAKVLLTAVYDVLESGIPEHQIPVVLASRHGDLRRTIDLLNELVKGEPLSPTQFCLSVNNAVLGQLSVITDNQQAMTTVGAGEDSFASAWLEGILQLQTNSHILIVYADEQPPEPYTPHCSSPSLGMAFAALLSQEATPASRHVSFHRTAHQSESTNDVVDIVRALHQSLSQGKGQVNMQTQSTQWRWHVAS